MLAAVYFAFARGIEKSQRLINGWVLGMNGAQKLITSNICIPNGRYRGDDASLRILHCELNVQLLQQLGSILS